MTNPMAAHAADLDMRANAPLREVVDCPGNAFVIRVRLAGGRVDRAWSTGRMLRNMNVLLRGGLDADGRPSFVQQAHCLCNDGHALAAIRALEDLAGTSVPRAALVVRSLVQGMRCMQEHLLHFYQFHLADWAPPGSALCADPALAARLDHTSGRDPDGFRRVQDRVRALAEARDDGGAPISPDHPGFCGGAELHLLLHAHALDALRAGGELQSALALLGCGPQGFRAYMPGGLPDDLDLGPAVLARLRARLDACRTFVRQVLLPDLGRLARAYPEAMTQGRGATFLAWSDFVRPGGGECLFPGGVVRADAAGDGARPARFAAVAEEREPAWSAADRARYRLLPRVGDPAFRWGQGAFAWLSVPRHDGLACEAGAVARVLGGLAAGEGATHLAASGFPDGCGLGPAALNSTLGRVLARGVECAVLADAVPGWLDELDALPTRGGDRRTELRLPASGQGVGLAEVPRGGLAHVIRLEDRRVADHDYLIPSLWNFSPRDAHGGPGPLELALAGTPVADASHPLELLRIIHELDPCNACHLVVEDADAGRTFVVGAA